MTMAKLTERVKAEIEKLRPYLQADGGDIEFVELTDENVVKVKLLGACGSCPYSLMTLKQGVEQALKKVIPEVEAVEQVN
ncbi:MAG: NifU family protein [Bacteroidales bacterium]|jgi:Fe-S cluster biogenesis protein NfuA